MALTLESVASSLLLLPWSCWWTEVSGGPAWSLTPLQEEETWGQQLCTLWRQP